MLFGFTADCDLLKFLPQPKNRLRYLVSPVTSELEKYSICAVYYNWATAQSRLARQAGRHQPCEPKRPTASITGLTRLANSRPGAEKAHVTGLVLVTSPAVMSGYAGHKGCRHL